MEVFGGKVPYLVGMKDNSYSSFVFAGWWEGWKDPANDQWVHTCTANRMNLCGKSTPGCRSFYLKISRDACRSTNSPFVKYPLIADAGHESRKLARTMKRHQGWQLRIVKRRQRAFKITGLTWIVERSFAWLGRNRRLSKDYEYRVQTSETMIDLAAIRLMLNRIALA